MFFCAEYDSMIVSSQVFGAAILRMKNGDGLLIFLVCHEEPIPKSTHTSGGRQR